MSKPNESINTFWKIYTDEEFDKMIRDCFECGTSLPISEHITLKKCVWVLTGYYYICKKCYKKKQTN